MNRLVLSLLLLSVLGSCRIVCATAECHAAHEWSSPADPDGTVPHPVNDDDCICNGAVCSEPAELRLDPCLAQSPLDPPFWFALVPGLDAGAGGDFRLTLIPGSSLGAGLVQDPRRRCARLQRFRC